MDLEGFILGISLVSMVGNILLFCAVVSLSRRISDGYPVTQVEMNTLLERVDKLGEGQSQLYRYLEALDDELGTDAYLVLRPRVPRPDRTFG